MLSEKQKEVVVRLDIPPDHHPGVIVGSGPGASIGREALKNLYEAYGKINDTAARVGDKNSLASAAQPFAERAIRNASNSIARMRKQVEHLDEQITSTLRKPSAQAAEVRAFWLAASSQSARSSFGELRKVIESGDLITASAIFEAPAYLSGLDEEQHSLLRKLAELRFSPELVNQRNETDEALVRVERATNRFMKSTADRLREWRDDDADIIEEKLG